MRYLSIVAATAALSLSASAYATEEAFSSKIIDSKGVTIGSVSASAVGMGTLFTVEATLPAGAHAIHLHQKAECVAPDFKSAGGHYNPEAHAHGLHSDKGFHAGDLPNLYVESTGHIKQEIFSSLPLSGEHGLLTQGVAMMIHEKADDYVTDPTGNAGGRIACAVLAKSKIQ